MVVCFRVKNLSIVGWDNVLGNGRFLYGIVHGEGNAMLMRGGACTAELRLMGLVVVHVVMVFLYLMYDPFVFVFFFFVGWLIGVVFFWVLGYMF